MKENILTIITKSHKVYSAMQVGLDTVFSNHLADLAMYTLFIDSKSEWAYKSLPDSTTREYDKLLYTETNEVLGYLEYYKPIFDFVYFHNRGDKSFQREVFNYTVKNKTKMILCHPESFHYKVSGYNIIRVHTEDGEYILYYRNIMQQDFEDFFNGNF